MTNSTLPGYDLESRLEPIEFLACSVNRVRVLTVLEQGPRDRREIENSVGLSRATLSRTLTRFERRGWIDGSGGRYELTELGAFVADEFLGLIDRMQVVEELREVSRWFPDERYGFDLARLADAEIVRASKENTLAPTNRLVDRLETAERARIVSYSVLPDCLEACWRNVTGGNQQLELIVEAPVVDAIASHPTMAAHVRELVASESARAFRYEGSLPHVFVVADDVVNLCLFDDDGTAHATIDTSDEAIREWAMRRFESYRRTAVPLESDARFL